MAKASDNLFPYVHLVPAAAPASPAAGSQRLYLDSADSNKLKRKDSSGTVTTIEGGGGGGGGTSGFTQCRKSADQGIPNNAWTALTWDTEDYDTLSAHSTSSNTSRLVAPATGIYVFNVSVAFASQAGNSARYLSYYKNGTQLPGWNGKDDASQIPISLSREIPLSAGDYLEAFVYQNSGSNVNILHDVATQLNGAIATFRCVGTV